MSAGRRPGPRGRLTDADLVTLAVLSHGPSHGHALWSRLAAAEVEDWAAVSRAQVYYSLAKLAERKLIRPARDAKDSTRRDRRTWQISAAGHRALESALASGHWAGQRAVPPFMTWAAISECARPADRKKVLAERREFLRSEIERKRSTLADLKLLPADAAGAEVARVLVNYVIRQMQLEIEMLAELGRLPKP